MQAGQGFGADGKSTVDVGSTASTDGLTAVDSVAGIQVPILYGDYLDVAFGRDEEVFCS